MKRICQDIISNGDAELLPIAYYCQFRIADNREQYRDSMSYAKKYLACANAEEKKKAEVQKYLDEKEAQISNMSEEERMAFFHEKKPMFYDEDESDNMDSDSSYMEDYRDYEEDFIFPTSSMSYLSDSEIDQLSQEDIQQAINEIYARHGRIFKDEPYNSYFRSCEWYVPLYEDDEFDDSCFNDYEKTNIQRLASYRDSGTEN